MTSSVFLSHNSVDKPFVRELARDMKRAGIKVWIDEAEIKIGDSIVDKIGKGIDEADYVVVVLSPNSVDSPWVQRELQVATHQEIVGKRIKVLPVLYKDCNIPSYLEDKSFADFRDSANYFTALQQILNSLVDDNEEEKNKRIENIRFKHKILTFVYVLRDVLLINVLTGLNGLILGILQIPMTAAISGIGQFVFMTIGFTIAGLLVSYRRWKHLIFVAVTVWAINFLGVLTVPEVTFVIWLLNLFPILIMMAIGGVLAQSTHSGLLMAREWLKNS